MSEQSKSRVAAGPKGGQSSQASEDDVEELRKLDQAYARIHKAVPTAPYFLSIPQDEPRYHHYSRQEAEAWMTGLGTMFEPHEEHLQYATFIYREQGDNCFVCRTAVDEERDRKAKAGRNAVATSKSYLEGSSKKRVSLGSYLGKANGTSKSQGQSQSQTSQLKSEMKPTGSDDEPTRSFKTDSPQANGVRAASKTAGKAVGPDHTKTAPKQEAPFESNAARSRKRPIEDERNSAIKMKPTDDIRPVKRAKNSPPSDSKKSSVNVAVSSTSTPHNLPPLLSPIDKNDVGKRDVKKHDPDEYNKNKYNLPTLLSPTLPPQVQQELDKLATQQRSRGVSDASNSSDNRSRLGSKTVPTTVVTAPTSDATHSKTGSKSLQPAFEPKSTVAVTKPKERLLVKLKYGKKLKQNIERILRLPGTPRLAESKRDRSRDPPPVTSRVKNQAPSPSAEKVTKSRDLTAPSKTLKNPASTTTSSIKSAAEKRARPDEAYAAPSVKRHKASSSTDLKEPRTPAQAAPSSPGASHPSSIQRNHQYLTPKKEQKSMVLARSSSDQGVDSLTPASADLSVKNSGGKPAPHRHHREINIWTARAKELNILGRSLKRENDDFSKRGSLSDEDKQRHAVRSLECILVYIAGFAAGDYTGRLDRTGICNLWPSLVAMCESIQYPTRDFPDLEALRLYLTVVVLSRSIVHLSQVIENLNADSNDIPVDHPRKGLKAISKILATNAKKQGRTALEAARALPMQKLMEQYPETWAARSVQTEPLEWEELKPGDFDRNGPYWIHAGAETTPVQAVRFGLKFLGEWMRTKSILKGEKIKVPL